MLKINNDNKMAVVQSFVVELAGSASQLASYCESVFLEIVRDWGEAEQQPEALIIAFLHMEHLQLALRMLPYSYKDTALIRTALAALPIYVRGSRPWEVALFNPHTKVCISIALAPTSKEEVRPKIVAVVTLNGRES